MEPEILREYITKSKIQRPMKNYLTLLLLLIIIFSCCDDDNEPQPEPITNVECSIFLRVQDKEGTDLLNSKNAGHYKSSDIEIADSKELNAVSIQGHSPDMGYNYLKLQLNYPLPNANKGKFYKQECSCKLTFGSNKADTVKGLYEIRYHEAGDCIREGYTIILQKACFNGVEVYNIESPQNEMWELPVVVKAPNKRSALNLGNTLFILPSCI